MIKLAARIAGFALVLLGLAGAVRADIVPDMYSAEVPVADQSPAELARASRAALSQVLVKVTGSAEVLRNPVIAAALANARNQVQQYSYGSDPANPRGVVVRPLFNESYVTGLVIEAGAPIWTANRPAALVWLVMDEGAGRQFVNADTAPAVLALLKAEFARRGVPLRLPLYDLADAAALSPDQAWGLDDPALILASTRYNLPDVLVGRYSRAGDGSIAGEWSYLYGDTRSLRAANAKDESLFLREGVALVAESMAARYAVAASANDGGLTLAVTGVTSYADYAAIVSGLESLELVERADLESVRGDTINLRLEARADAAQLAAIIELDKRFVPLPVLGPGTGLSYQWQQ